MSRCLRFWPQCGFLFKGPFPHHWPHWQSHQCQPSSVWVTPMYFLPFCNRASASLELSKVSHINCFSYVRIRSLFNILTPLVLTSILPAFQPMNRSSPWLLLLWFCLLFPKSLPQPFFLGLQAIVLSLVSLTNNSASDFCSVFLEMWIRTFHFYPHNLLYVQAGYTPASHKHIKYKIALSFRVSPPNWLFLCSFLGSFNNSTTYPE